MINLSNTAIEVDAAVAEICEDLDDLREGLIGALTRYESRLKKAMGAIPTWADVEPEDIHALYQIDDIDDALLGPRSVAIIAQTIEDHVDQWLGFPGEIVAKTLSDRELEAYRQSCAQVESELLALVSAARRTTADATLKLGENLDRIMNRLGDDREDDENALKDLVNEGSVEQGRSAQVEIATLWERYREHAEVLNQVWEELESLVFEGMDLIVAGVEDIRWIMRQSESALGMLNTAFAPEFEIEEPPERDQTRHTFEMTREPGVVFDAHTKVVFDANANEISQDEMNESNARETVELVRHLSEYSGATQDIQEPTKDIQDEASEDEEALESIFEKKVKTKHKIDLSGLSEISELVESFCATRTFTKITPVPLFEVLLWFIPLLACFAFVSLKVLNPTIIDQHNIPFLSVMMGLAGVFIVAFPFVRRWRFLPMPSLRIEESVDISIEIDDCVLIDKTMYTNEGFTLQRWTDQNDASFGWQLVADDIVIIGPETNLTRWQSSSSKILAKDELGAYLSKSKFRILCRALGIEL